MGEIPGGLLRPHSSKLAVLHRTVDALIIFFSLHLSNLAFHVPLASRYAVAGLWAVLFFLFFAEIKGLYHSWRLDSVRRELSQLAWVWTFVACSLIVLAFLTKTSEAYSRLVIVSWLLVAPALVGLLRVALRVMLHALRRQGRNVRTVAFAGAGKQAVQLVRQIEDAPWLGLKMVGIYDDRDPDATFWGDTNLQGGLDELVEKVRRGAIDYVYITLPAVAEKRTLQLVNDLADTTATVYVIPDLFIFDLLHARWTTFGGIPVVSVYESPFHEIDGWLKRAEDVVLGSLILALIALPMLLIALGVKLTSPGPVLFRQRRYGLNGEVIEVLKFRSMTVCEDGDDVPQAQKGDARVTPFGQFLRCTSLDELPQFFNVLGGSMSIVGPRPHAVAHNEQYRRLIHGYMLRHKVKPGITGWAQVNGWRGETDTLEKMKKRVEFDLAYMRNWSLWLDIKIILMTVYKGFWGKNVY